MVDGDADIGAQIAGRKRAAAARQQRDRVRILDAAVDVRRDRGELRHVPDELAAEVEPADRTEVGSVVILEHIADIDLGEGNAREVDGGADMGAETLRVPAEAAWIVLVVQTTIEAAADERLVARRELVGDAQVGEVDVEITRVLIERA